MDLSVNYMGLPLKSPLMPGASPMADDLTMVRMLEDAGASAIVMFSLFEEQITGEELATHRAIEDPAESFAEATSYLPPTADYRLGPDEYLDQIRRIKETVGIPVIGSLNGTTLGGWLEHARLIEQAGADALELNVYYLATDLDQSGEIIEETTLGMVKAVKSQVKIPVAVKLSPYYTSVANFASKLVDVGADGLVIFNRFYQPDIDIETLEMMRLNLSSQSELLLRMRWIAVLSGRVKTSLAASGGVHTVEDAIKVLMTGADTVQVVSALLRHGPNYLAALRQALEKWLEEHEYESLAQLQGSMSLQNTPDPAAYERANYTRLLQSWTANA